MQRTSQIIKELRYYVSEAEMQQSLEKEYREEKMPLHSAAASVLARDYGDDAKKAESKLLTALAQSSDKVNETLIYCIKDNAFLQTKVNNLTAKNEALEQELSAMNDRLQQIESKMNNKAESAWSCNIL